MYRSRKVIFFLILILVLGVFLAFAFVMNSQSTSLLIDGSDSFAIDAKDLPIVMRKANSGDVESMRRLFGYYAVFLNDSEASDEWRMRLANEGDMEFLESAIANLESSPLDADKIEARRLKKKWEEKLKVKE